jgi:polysaccharide biosynthesis transport protein
MLGMAMSGGEDRQFGEGVPAAPMGMPAYALEISRLNAQSAHFASGGAPPTTTEGFFEAFHEYLRIIRRFKWVIMGIVVAAVAIGGARTLMTTRLYTSGVRLQIDRSVAKVVQGGEVAPAENGDFEFLRTQYELLQSRSIAERAVSSLNLAEDPEYAQGAAPTLFARIVGFFRRSPPRPEVARAAIERSIASIILANRVVRL